MGKRHALAASVAGCGGAPPPLAIECRQAALGLGQVRAAFAPYGRIAAASLEEANPLDGVKPEARKSGKPGPWFAMLLYADAAAAAKALGQRYLYVDGRRVYVEPLEGAARRAEGRRRLLAAGGAGASA